MADAGCALCGGVTCDTCDGARMLNKLEGYLKTHDWHYEYSDDFRVWSNGSRQATEIRTMLFVIKDKRPDLAEQADELYNSYKPQR